MLRSRIVRSLSYLALIILAGVGTARAASRPSVAKGWDGPSTARNGNVQSPRDFLGFTPGDDRKLADWSLIVAYFKQLAAASPKVSLNQAGLTTERRPFIYALISSEDNIKNLAAIREAQRKLADPRLVPGNPERDKLIRETPSVVAITCSIHSTEIVASQMSMELAYRLVTDDSAGTREILHNTILLLVPSVNPDGISIVTNWYRETLGTKFEGTPPPFLYHHYVGHDDNRDWFMLTQVETQELATVLWKEWFPEIVYDVHQQGEYGSRMCMPPFFDPPNPNIDPVILREVGLIGSQMALNLTASGFKGVVTNSTYDTWWHGGLRTAPYYHNEIGILTEAASTKIATPLDIKREELRAPVRGLQNPLVTATNFPVAWEGGTWHNSDILAMELVTTRTVLQEASSNREFLIRNYVDTASRQIEAGKTEAPYAYVIPAPQRDYPTAARMINILAQQGVEVHQATSDFAADGKQYPKGSFVILMAQPFRANVKCLFEAQHYPDRRLYPGGPAEPPYDVAGWTLPMQMGVDYQQVDHQFAADLKPITEISFTGPSGQGAMATRNSKDTIFYLSPDANNAFALVNWLLKQTSEYSVTRVAGSVTKQFEPGGFNIECKGNASGKTKAAKDAAAESASKLLSQANALGITLTPGGAPQMLVTKPAPLKQPRIGLYKSWVASMDEGWTRWILEQFGFEYTTLTDRDIRAGNLNARFDVIILPDEGEEQIVKGNKDDSYPSEYTGGVGDAGVANLKAFAESGGVLLCLDTASDLALRHFDLPVKNVLAGLHSNQFYAPGSVFRAAVDSSSPISFGMPPQADLYFVAGSRRGGGAGPGRGSSSSSNARPSVASASTRAIQPESNSGARSAGSDARGKWDASLPERGARPGGSPGSEAEERSPLVSAFAFDITDPSRAQSVARYIDGNPLRSGWLLGPNYIAGHSALVDVNLGQGRVVLFGFRCQHRAQTWGTFKLLFNAIYLGAN